MPDAFGDFHANYYFQVWPEVTRIIDRYVEKRSDFMCTEILEIAIWRIAGDPGGNPDELAEKEIRVVETERGCGSENGGIIGERLVNS